MSFMGLHIYYVVKQFKSHIVQLKVKDACNAEQILLLELDRKVFEV